MHSQVSLHVSVQIAIVCTCFFFHLCNIHLYHILQIILLIHHIIVHVGHGWIVAEIKSNNPQRDYSHIIVFQYDPQWDYSYIIVEICWNIWNIQKSQRLRSPPAHPPIFHTSFPRCQLQLWLCSRAAPGSQWLVGRRAHSCKAQPQRQRGRPSWNGPYIVQHTCMLSLCCMILWL